MTDIRIVPNQVIVQALAANRNATDGNAAQSLFDSASDALSLPIGNYEYETLAIWGGTGAATTHTTSISYAGSATLSNIAGLGAASGKTAQATFNATNSNLGVRNSAAAIVGTATNTLEGGFYWERGFISISVAGTIIPQITFSAAPGNTPIFRAGSFFRIRKLDANPTGIWG